MNLTTSTVGVQADFSTAYAPPPPDDWLSANTRRVLGGDRTNRRGLILAAQELAWSCSEMMGFASADLLWLLLVPAAARAGITSKELSCVCRAVAQSFAEPGRRLNVGSLLPELVHLAVDPAIPARKRKTAATRARVEAASGMGWE